MPCSPCLLTRSPGGRASHPKPSVRAGRLCETQRHFAFDWYVLRPRQSWPYTIVSSCIGACPGKEWETRRDRHKKSGFDVLTMPTAVHCHGRVVDYDHPTIFARPGICHSTAWYIQLMCQQSLLLPLPCDPVVRTRPAKFGRHVGPPSPSPTPAREREAAWPAHGREGEVESRCIWTTRVNIQ